MGRSVLVAVLFSSFLVACAVQAGSGSGAILYTFNTSARYEGMAGAGVGSPWGSATNHWANPAQLAYRRGLQREWARSELAQGLADDIILTNEEYILGLGGLTFLLGRGPADGLHLDMGNQEGTDENGDPTGVFHSYMRSQSYGLAFDAVQVVDYWRSRSGPPSHLQRYFSFALGYVAKDFEDKLTPDEFLQDPSAGGDGHAETHDLGWVMRVTPVNTLDSTEPFGFLLGAAYGASLLNGGDEVIEHPDADQSDPLPRAHLKGWSVHAEMGLGQEYWRQAAPGFLAQLHATFNPLLSLTYAHQKSEPGYIWDPQRQVYVYEHDTSGTFDEIGRGWELGLANIFYIRRGHFEAIYSDIDEDTEGWGVNIQIADKAGWRYDQATVPQAAGLPQVDRETWSFWVDPVALFGN